MKSVIIVAMCAASLLTGCGTIGGLLGGAGLDTSGVIKSVEAGQHGDTEVRFSNNFGVIVPVDPAEVTNIVHAGDTASVSPKAIEVTPAAAVTIPIQ